MKRPLQWLRLGLLACALPGLANAQPHPDTRRPVGQSSDQTRHQRKGTPARCVPDDQGRRGKRHPARRQRDETQSARVAARLPSVTRFAPASGITPATVRIFGSNFAEPMRVTLNGRRLKVTSITPTRLVIEVPAGAGSGYFKLIRPGLPRMVIQPPFEAVPTPRIYSIRPRRVRPGELITVKGQGFSPRDRFLLDGQPIEVVSSLPRQVRLKAPAGPRSGRIALMRRGRTLATWSGTIQIGRPAPVIASFDPPQGGPGTVVHLRGMHFGPKDRVFLAGRQVPINQVRPRQIDVVIGTSHRGGRFMLRGRRGRRALSTGVFQIIQTPQAQRFYPRSALTGSVVRVYGRHFDAGDQVYLGNTRLEVIRVRPTLITTKIPSSASSGRISVRRGSQAYFVPGTFVLLIPPSVTGVSPTSATPGTVVTIEGTGLTGDTHVRLNGLRLSVVRRQVPTRLMVRLPPRATSGRLVVTTRRGAYTMTHDLTVLRRAHLRRFVPRRGPPGTTVTLYGADFHPGMKLYLGPTELPLSDITPTRATTVIPPAAASGRFVVHSRGGRLSRHARFTVIAPARELSFKVRARSARPGQDVVLTLNPPTARVRVYLAGRELPTRVIKRGRRIVVTVPGNARSGFIEVEYRGRRYRSARILRIVR